MKKLLTILLTSFMVLCAVNTNVYAESSTENSDLDEYEVYVDENYDEYKKITMNFLEIVDTVRISILGIGALLMDIQITDQ